MLCNFEPGALTVSHPHHPAEQACFHHTLSRSGRRSISALPAASGCPLYPLARQIDAAGYRGHRLEAGEIARLVAPESARR